MTEKTPLFERPEDFRDLMLIFSREVKAGKAEVAAQFLSQNPWLVRQKFNNVQTGNNRQPFVHTVLYWNAPDLVAQGLAMMAPLEDRCDQGKTALHALLQWLKDRHEEAVNNFNPLDFTPLVEQFIEAGARLDSVDNMGEPMWIPAMVLPLPIFEKFLEHAPTLDFMRAEGWSGLSIALCRASFDKVKLIVQKGADVNFFDPRGLLFAPILCAFWYEFQEMQTYPAEMADYLLSHGARLDIKDALQRTLLHHAPNAQAVSWFLEHGLDLEAKDAFGRTPLLHTVGTRTLFCEEIDQLGIVTALVVAGANLEARDTQDTSLCVRDMIMENEKNMPEIANMILSFEVRKRVNQIMAETVTMNADEMCLPSP